MEKSALVVCIGNELVADDAVGHAVYRSLLKTALPPETRLEYCGVGGIALLEYLSGSDELMIVVDAVQLGTTPGTVHTIEWSSLVPVSEGAAVSAHGIGLKDTISIGMALYPERMPGKTVLVGIEGRCFDELGGPMTPEVAAAVEPAVMAVLSELDNSLHGAKK